MSFLLLADLSVEERLALLYLDTSPELVDLPIAMRARLVRLGVAERTREGLVYTPLGRRLARETAFLARNAA